MGKDITMEELLHALEEAGHGTQLEGDGHTAAELMEIWGCARSRVLKVLAEAKRAGLVSTSRKCVQGIDDRLHTAPCYSFKKGKKVRTP